ncbi:rod shape-determining protein MreD [Altererythrobacter indicus]|uniref:Rod shape-determining protein MreD n=1 Tax=Altericroceibacterium indicum TaxID=374177 RepID=A0A845A9C9_9SPHN|nr:rod shape-determining protein MreD [Altericroceibacterium indicum]MXP25156.1 rod shape-determining protein MreD [Altericroceibacterium indicum]
MISSSNSRAHRDAYGSQINRDHLPILVYGIPWLTIILASLVPMVPFIALAPILPPLGYLFLLTWRLVRPGLLPLWAGLPLGAFDDLFSGQPFGSGIFLFSVTLLSIEAIEIRFPWRNFLLDWFTASLALSVYLYACFLFSGAQLTSIQLRLILPQLLLSIVLFPIIARIVALLDRFRLMRIRKVR